MGTGKLRRGLPERCEEGSRDEEGVVGSTGKARGRSRRQRGKQGEKNQEEVKELKVAHLNIGGGWGAKKEDIMKVCDQEGIQVLVCTETQMTDEARVSIGGWNCVSRGRPVGQQTEGGMCILSRRHF